MAKHSGVDALMDGGALRGCLNPATGHLYRLRMDTIPEAQRHELHLRWVRERAQLVEVPRLTAELARARAWADS